MKKASQSHRRHNAHKELSVSHSKEGRHVTFATTQNVTGKENRSSPFTHLETLVTRLHNVDVTDLTLLRNTCDTGDMAKDLISTPNLKRINQWFEIALNEGHIEPSTS